MPVVRVGKSSVEGEHALSSLNEKALDAEWKRIQQKTFTRWCNEHLKKSSLFIRDLNTDLHDGTLLISLIEMLADKKVGRYNKRPRNYPQKLENVSLALRFIQKEGIRLVNIGGEDIAQGNIKLILGLIWTLILHYQISVALADEGTGKMGPSPKQALLTWLQGMLKDRKKITNLTKDWNDGTAVAALVDAMAPGLFPEYNELDPANAVDNATQAMKLADDWLGVPMVLAPADMCNPHVDELSMMTYLSQYPDAQLKEGAPIRRPGDAMSCSARGPGLERHGVKVTRAATFTVFTPKGAAAGVLEIICEGPGKTNVPVKQVKNSDGTYSCEYVPVAIGDHRVIITYNKMDIPRSPFQVEVSPVSDATRCRAWGPGVDGTGLVEKKPAKFSVKTKGAGEGELSFSVSGPDGPLGADQTELKEASDGQFNGFYIPSQAGPHTVTLQWAGVNIPGSPFDVTVAPTPPDASKVKVHGPGVESEHLTVGVPAPFKVLACDAGRGELSVSVRSRKGAVECDVKDNGDGTFDCQYVPDAEGDVFVKVRWSNIMIPNSPFRVAAEPPVDASLCVASGPGIEPRGLRTGQPAPFQVKTRGAGPGELQVEVQNTQGQPVPCDMRRVVEGVACSYTPVFAGEYCVAVTFDGEHIPNSPFTVGVCDPSKVRVRGPGLDGLPVKVGDTLRYDVDTSDAGPGELEGTHQQGNRLEQPCEMKRIAPDHYAIDFTPDRAGTEKLLLNYGGFPAIPHNVNVLDPSRVKVHGKGVEAGLIAGEAAPFTVDPREAGDAPVSVHVDGPSKVKVDCVLGQDRTYHCMYYPNEPGQYQIHVLFANEALPISPLSVDVTPATDPGKVIVSGPGVQPTGLISGKMTYFDVDARRAGQGDLDTSIIGPQHIGVDVNVTDNGDGTFHCEYEPHVGGTYNIQVFFANAHVPKSPYNVKVKWATDPSRVKVSGDGLESGVAGDKLEFTIDPTEAGDGDLSLLMEGPAKPETNVVDNPDGTKTVTFVPPVEGDYFVKINFNDTPIPGAPFKVDVEPATDANRVRAFGPGLRPEGVIVGDKADFKIDTKGAGRGDLKVTIDDPKPGASTLRVKAAACDQFTSDAEYNPRAVGTYNVNVFYAGTHIFDSPFTVGVCDPKKCRLKGPGIGNKDLARVGKPVEYHLDATAAGPGTVKALARDPRGAHNDLAVEPVSGKEGEYKLSLTPDDAGTYGITVSFAGHNIPNVPFALGSVDPSKLKVTGNGLDGGVVGDTLKIDVDAKEAGPGGLNLGLEGPGKANAKVDDHKDGTFTVNFTPYAAGEYRINMKFADEVVENSPFRIPVRDVSKAKVLGLDKGPFIVGEEIPLKVDTRQAGPLDEPVVARIQTPTGASYELPVDCDGAGRSIVHFTPEEPGEFELDLNLLGEQLPGMPEKIAVADPSRCVLDSGGLECACVGEPAYLTVDTADAGKADLEVAVLDARNRKLPVSVRALPDEPSRYEVEFTPNAAGDVFVDAKYANRPLTETPLVVPVADPSKCRAYGPGLEAQGLKARRLTYFDVETSGAGVAEVEVSIVNVSTHQATDCVVTNAGKGVYHVEYEPPAAGSYEINIRFADKLVADSPYSVSVCDPTKVTAYGPGIEDDVIVKEKATFTVDMREAGQGQLDLLMTGPANTEVEYKDNNDGTVDVIYVAQQPGRYDVRITYSDEEIPNSPYQASVIRPPPDANKVMIKDLSAQPLVKERNEFTVDGSAAGGPGLLEVGVAGGYVPAEEITVRHVGECVFAVSYQINEPGETLISVRWHGNHVPGSPFTVYVSETSDAVDL